jgi:phage host-nuclease inhibitor protein Gam
MTGNRNMERTYQIIDNQVVEVSTGEILCEALAPEGIASQTALEAVLERIGKAEAVFAGKKQHHDSIRANMAKIEQRELAKIAYLRDLYEAHIETYAKARLDGQKSKTLLTAYGNVSFRTTAGGVRVSDKSLALATAHKFGWVEAIKTTEEFQISRITSDQKQLILETVPEGFVVVPDTETMTVKVLA